ncbi:hypothetical protein IFM5058_09365 [Aspergillus udagawae]|nr:hypothetical protein IFM5058_09365 [Aspergillus udagawae]
MTLDAVGYAVAVDAWRYGEADGKRVCVEVLGTGMDPTLALLTEAVVGDVLRGIVLGGPKTSQELALKPYAI